MYILYPRRAVYNTIREITILVFSIMFEIYTCRYKCGKGREFLDPVTKETYDSRFHFILLLWNILLIKLNPSFWFYCKMFYILFIETKFSYMSINKLWHILEALFLFWCFQNYNYALGLSNVIGMVPGPDIHLWMNVFGSNVSILKW